MNSGTHRTHPKVLAVMGAQGGVGKSIVVAAIAFSLLRRGSSVVLVDSDPISGCMGEIFGAGHWEYSLGDVISGRAALDDAMVSTPYEDLRLMTADIGPRSADDPAFGDKLLAALRGVDAEYVLLELGAERSAANLDLLTAAASGFIVSSPEAMSAAHDLLRAGVLHRLMRLFDDAIHIREHLALMFGGDDAGMYSMTIGEKLDALDPGDIARARSALAACSLYLIVNMASRDASGEGDMKAVTLRGSVEKSLGINLRALGSLGMIEEMEGLKLDISSPVFAPGSALMKGIGRVIDHYMDKNHMFVVPAGAGKKDTEDSLELTPLPIRPLRPDDTSELQMGFNDDIDHAGRVVHVQTEDLGDEKRQILTLVYADGTILFSKVTGYDELGAGGNLKRAVKARVQWQHRGIIAGIRGGKLDDKLR